jgi:hypothetical protein
MMSDTLVISVSLVIAFDEVACEYYEFTISVLATDSEVIYTDRLGIGGRYFLSLSFCFDLVLPVLCSGNVCATECNSRCLVHQYAAVSQAMAISFNVAGRAVSL